MLTYILILLAVGLVIGALGRLAVPGPDPMPIWATIALGIAGAFVGGIIGGIVGAGGPIFAVIGAALLVIAYRRLVQRRGITGPAARRRP